MYTDTLVMMMTITNTSRVLLIRTFVTGRFALQNTPEVIIVIFEVFTYF